MSNKKKIVYIVNPKSGLGRQSSIEDEIAKNTNKDEIEYEIVYTEYRGHASEIAARQRDMVDVVVAVGGDGTVNEIGSSLLNCGTAMGIIPCGSGNGLARELDIPLRLSQAIQIANEGDVKSIDVMKINDYYSLNVAGIGFDAFISHKFSKVKTRGPLQYMNLIAREYPKYKAREYVLDIDNHIFQRKAFFISFANSTQWGNNVHIAPGARIDDGLIDICIVSEFPNFAIPSLLISLLSQSIDKNKYDEIIKAKEIELYNKRRLLGHIDGEPIIITPHAHISVMPLALKVVIPNEEFYSTSRFTPGNIRDFIQNNIPNLPGLPNLPNLNIPNPFSNDKKDGQKG